VVPDRPDGGELATGGLPVKIASTALLPVAVTAAVLACAAGGCTSRSNARPETSVEPKPKTTKKPDVSWGKEHNGLKAGLLIKGGSAHGRKVMTFDQEGPIELEFHLHNAGKKVVALDGRRATIHGWKVVFRPVGTGFTRRLDMYVRLADYTCFSWPAGKCGRVASYSITCPSRLHRFADVREKDGFLPKGLECLPPGAYEVTASMEETMRDIWHGKVTTGSVRIQVTK
jgi:hypothetical protein